MSSSRRIQIYMPCTQQVLLLTGNTTLLSRGPRIMGSWRVNQPTGSGKTSQSLLPLSLLCSFCSKVITNTQYCYKASQETNKRDSLHKTRSALTMVSTSFAQVLDNKLARLFSFHCHQSTVRTTITSVMERPCDRYVMISLL